MALGLLLYHFRQVFARHVCCTLSNINQNSHEETFKNLISIWIKSYESSKKIVNTQHTYLEQLHYFKYTGFYFWRLKSLLIFTQLRFTQVYLKVHKCNDSLSIRQITIKTLRTYVWNWWWLYLSIWQKLFIYNLPYSNLLFIKLLVI